MNGTGLLNDVMSAVCKFLCKVHGMRDDHNYSPMLHVLFGDQQYQPNICDQEVTNLLWTLLEELKDISDSTNVFPRKIKNWMDQKRPTQDIGIQTDVSVEMNNSKFVQITCNNHEFNRRIDAFIRRKRAESDAFNRREFCQMTTNPNEISCARTNAIFVPRQTKKSLLKIERVKNLVRNKQVGLNMEDLKAWPPAHPSSILPFNKLPNDMKERITNLKSVLFPNRSVTEYADVYKQVKSLETRVLYLESLSPEYFQGQIKHATEVSDLMTTHAEIIQQVPLQESDKKNDILLDLRIKELEERLESKANELRNN